MVKADIKNNPTVLAYIFYSLGSIANGWSASVIGFNIYTYIINVISITSFQYGAISIITQVFNAVSDPLIGILSDHTKTKLGRRRPYILAAAIIMPTFYFLLFTRVPISSQGLRVFYYLVMYIMFYVGQTLFNIPQIALVMELSDSETIRTNYVMYNAAFYSVGTLLGPLVMYLFEEVVYSKAQQATAFIVSSAIAAVIMAICIFVVFFYTRERNTPIQQKAIKDVLKESICTLKYKSYVYLMLTYICGQIAVQTVHFNIRNYFQHVTSLDIYFPAIIVAIVFSLIGTFVLRFIITKVGKKITFIIGLGVFLLAEIIIIAYVPSGLFGNILSIILAAMVGIGTASVFFISACMINDVITEDYIKTGLRREGAFSSLYVFFQKIGTGLAQAVTAAIIGASGDFVKNPEGVSFRVQPQAIVNAIRYTISAVPIFFILLCFLWLYKYPLTKKKVAENQSAIDNITNDEAATEMTRDTIIMY